MQECPPGLREARRIIGTGQRHLIIPLLMRRTPNCACRLVQLTARRGCRPHARPLQEWGSVAPKIPPSEAKNRLALVTAAKAVALALTPGLDPIDHVTMWSKRRGQVGQDGQTPCALPRQPPHACSQQGCWLALAAWHQ